MKKKFLGIAALLLSSLLTAPAVFAADAAPVESLKPFSVDVPYGNPTVDGAINQGEWSLTTALTLDATTCTADPWNNGINSTGKFFYCWSEAGLYIAADMADPETQLASEPGAVYQNDAFQLAVNPGNLLADGSQGVFFSIGMTESGELAVMRHNYGDADGVGAAPAGEAITKFTGKGSVSATGWQFELLLPWDQVHVADVEGAAALVPAADLKEGFMLCYLDRPAEADVKTGAGFEVQQYLGTMVLRAPKEAPAETAAPETAAPAPAETVAPEAPVVDAAPAPEAPVAAPQTGDAVGIVTLLATLAASAGAILSLKKRK